LNSTRGNLELAVANLLDESSLKQEPPTLERDVGVATSIGSLESGLGSGLVEEEEEKLPVVEEAEESISVCRHFLQGFLPTHTLTTR